MSSSRRTRKKSVRPIGNRRDFEGASAVAKRLSDDAQRDSAAELRLKSLLRELDKFDEVQEDEGEDQETGYEASGPGRRWSDDEQFRNE